MPFEIEDIIYDSRLIIYYCNFFKISCEKISMKSQLIKDNLIKKEWFNEQFENGISILDVIIDKKTHQSHYNRMINAEMKYPVIIWKEKDLVIDGNHRLGNAYINNYDSINAFIVNNELMEKFSLGKFKDRDEYESIVKHINEEYLMKSFSERFLI